MATDQPEGSKMYLGDYIANLTKKIGATPCTPCQERQRKLNQMHIQTSQRIQSFLRNFSRGGSGSSQ